MNTKQNLTVISFIGPSGAGKSTAIKALSTKHNVLKEKYIELNRYQLDNRLMLSKWAYNQYWFNGILQAKNDGITLLLSDRCPIDTCAYVLEGRSELLDIVNISFKELTNLNIFIKKVLVIADFEILQARIDTRLIKDQRRINYNESDIQHNKRAYDFYHENMSLWDCVIDTSTATESDLLGLFDSIIVNIISNTK